MNTVKVKAFAKVNLTLEIVGVQDGFHMLNSVVASVDLFDLIVLKKRKDKLSFVEMKGVDASSIPPERNNTWKAVERFSEKFGVNGANVTVYRNIPAGAGLGGSSADISGALVGMAKLYNVQDKDGIIGLANELGSDTRYMLDGGFARMQGRGEKVEFFSSNATLYFLAICPKTPVLSGECYRQYDKNPTGGEKGATEKCMRALIENNPFEVGKCLTNDLFAPAVQLNDDVRIAYEEAQSFSPLGVVMTGSGSCVMAMFETRELAEWAKSRYRGKYACFTCKTVAKKDTKKWKNPFVLGE